MTYDIYLTNTASNRTKGLPVMGNSPSWLLFNDVVCINDNYKTVC